MLLLNINKNNWCVLIVVIVVFGIDDLNIMFFVFFMLIIIIDFYLFVVQVGWIGIIINLGMFVGGLIFGLLVDCYNKFKVFKWMILIFLIVIGLVFFIINLLYFYIMCFIVGIGVGGEYGIVIVIMVGIVLVNKMGWIFLLNGIVG